DTGEKLMENGKASALIEIPENFSRDFLDRKPAEIRLVKNPAETFLPVIVEEMVKTMVVLLDRAAFVFAGPIDMARIIFDSDRWPTGGEIERILEDSKDGITLAGGYISGSILKFKTETVSDPKDNKRAVGFNIFAFVLPGSMIFGLLFISEITLRDLIREKGAGTLQRILVAPLRGMHVVTGKVMVTFCITAVTCIIILVISAIGFGVNVGRPLPLIIHFVGVILMSTGLMSFFYGFINSERTADAVMSVIIIVMALFGGSMIPFEQLNGTLQAIGHFSPVYWAADGFKQIFMMDAGLNDILIDLVVVYGIAVVTLLPGSFLLEKKLGTGD
ncbi:ABC transporter permease, partial [bacterium]|nr:ABC transporter permease [bacterium]